MTRVRDVMRRDVVTVSIDMSVREVSRTMVREGIGGAPVTDGGGTVLGVLSSRDVMRAAAREPEVEMAVGGRVPVFGAQPGGKEDDVAEYTPSFFLPEDMPPFAWTAPVLVRDAMDERMVVEVMTPAAFSVPADLPFEELAEFLVRGRILRRRGATDGDHYELRRATSSRRDRSGRRERRLEWESDIVENTFEVTLMRQDGFQFEVELGDDGETRHGR